MRQIKPFGIAYTVICAIIGIALALDEFPFKDAADQHSVVAIQITGSVEDTVVWLVLFSVIFILGASILLFNFLRSLKARDFYCSTPNSICSVWLGFITSIMTWAAIGVVASNLIQLPFLLIADVKYFPTWLLTVIGTLAIDLLACGIMSLACALTGRIISMLLTAAALLFLPMSIYVMATAAFDSFFCCFNFIVDAITDWDIYYGYRINIITSSPLIFGCLLLGVIYLALAAWFMTVRTGDAAGRPFVNKSAHFISLMAVSFITTSFVADMLVNAISDTLLCDDIEKSMVEITFESVVSILAVIISFWAANVILTFDIKKSHRTLKYLPIPVVLCAAIFGAGFAVTNADFHTVPTSDEVESFTLVRNDYLNDDLAIYRMRDTYGRIVTQNYEFTDKKVINYVTNEIDEFIQSYNKDFRSVYSSVYSSYFSDNYEPQNTINIKLNLKNGGSITRAIPCDDEFRKALADAIKNDSEYMKKFTTMPDAKYTNINIFDCYAGYDEIISDEEAVKLYESFTKEFSELSNDNKIEYLKSSIYSSYSYDFDSGMYYDEQGGYFTDMSEDEYTDSEYQIVSDSDIDLEDDDQINFVISDLTEEQGEYHASMYGYTSTPSLNEIELMNIRISGYKDGKLYDTESYFEQSFTLNPKLFPETCKLLTEICNRNMKSFLEIPEKMNDTSSFIIDAHYYNGKDMLNMQYDYIDQETYGYILESRQNGYSYFYDPYYDYIDDEGNQVYLLEEYKISGREYVQKLFDDAAKTTNIDLSKPYCKVYVSFDKEYYSVYIQTESLIDLLVNDQAAAEGSTAAND